MDYLDINSTSQIDYLDVKITSQIHYLDINVCHGYTMLIKKKYVTDIQTGYNKPVKQG